MSPELYYVCLFVKHFKQQEKQPTYRQRMSAVPTFNLLVVTILFTMESVKRRKEEKVDLWFLSAGSFLELQIVELRLLLQSRLTVKEMLQACKYCKYPLLLNNSNITSLISCFDLVCCEKPKVN